MELELEYNIEEMQREMEMKFKDKYASLNQKYKGEIEELHYSIENIEKVVVELNMERTELREQIENGALREECLNKKMQEFEEKEVRFEAEKQKFRDNTDRKSLLIERMKEDNERLQNKIKEIILNPVLRELPVELNVFTDTEEQEAQTDELLDLFLNLEVL